MVKGDQDRTGMVQVELSDEDRKERAMRAAAEQVELDGLYEKKRSHNREWNEQIRQREELISQLSLEADDGMAWVPAQTDMFGGANDTDEEEPEQPKPRRGKRRRGAAAGNHVGDAA